MGRATRARGLFPPVQESPVSIRLEDPIILAALVGGVSAVISTLINGLVQIVCTRMQNRPKKPPSKKSRSKPRKRRRRHPQLARPPPQHDVVSLVALRGLRPSCPNILWFRPCKRSGHRVPCTDRTFESQVVRSMAKFMVTGINGGSYEVEADTFKDGGFEGHWIDFGFRSAGDWYPVLRVRTADVRKIERKD